MISCEKPCGAYRAARLFLCYKTAITCSAWCVHETIPQRNGALRKAREAMRSETRKNEQKTSQYMNSANSGRAVFRTWDEVFHHLGIAPLKISGTETGVRALEMLREHYNERGPVYDNDAAIIDVLMSEELDHVVSKDGMNTRSTREQLNAIGDVLISKGFRFCFQIEKPYYKAWVMKVSDTQEYLNLWKPVLTRNQFFNNIQTFCIREQQKENEQMLELCDSAFSFVGQACAEWEKPESVYIIGGTRDVPAFLIIPETRRPSACTPCESVTLRAFRFDGPCTAQKEARCDLEYDRHSIEPYTMTIAYEGKTYVFIGNDIANARSWKPARKDRNGNFVPVYDDDMYKETARLVRCVTGKVAKKDLLDIDDMMARMPVINLATAKYFIDNSVVYAFTEYMPQDNGRGKKKTVPVCYALRYDLVSEKFSLSDDIFVANAQPVCVMPDGKDMLCTVKEDTAQGEQCNLCYMRPDLGMTCVIEMDNACIIRLLGNDKDKTCAAVMKDGRIVFMRSNRAEWNAFRKNCTLSESGSDPDRELAKTLETMTWHGETSKAAISTRSSAHGIDDTYIVKFEGIESTMTFSLSRRSDA